eukprot:TRINITY_DN73685_c0_g1_i1.p1 TRINITY_DN73685_c0_g1~~TRINITY_DN73685_c0_g1_i1.p1  ORF type:complete len:457 (-),score=73.06 TRINITY_DN73685_c0_g1_i1:24-1394(-)
MMDQIMLQKHEAKDATLLAVTALLGCWCAAGDLTFAVRLPRTDSALCRGPQAGVVVPSHSLLRHPAKLCVFHIVEGKEDFVPSRRVLQRGFQERGGRMPRLGVAALFGGLTLGLRGSRRRRAAKASATAAARAASRVIVKVAEALAPASRVQDLATRFCNLFAVWVALAAVCAIKAPATFNWIPSNAFTGLLGLLMLSVGITTTVDDFVRCFDRPGSLVINFISCYGLMPALAFMLAKVINADGPVLAGLVLVGAICGGQASNLCTLIARGDVALSVLMTTTTTLGTIFMTPLVCKLAIGAVVPVDAMGIIMSTFQVVLGPIFLGVGLNSLAPAFRKVVAPFTPVLGVVSTVLLVGASVAKCAAPIAAAGLPLQLACLALHLLGGILGYALTKAFGYDERTCRTVAIETSMKGSAFGFLLASNHFGAFNVRVPPAVSLVWMAITGSVLAVYWKGKQ